MTSMMSYAEFITSLMKLIGEQKYYLEATSCTKQYEEDHDLHHHQQEQNWKQRNPHQQNETDRILYSLRRLLEDRYLHLLEKSTKITSLFWNKDTVSASFHHFHDRIKVNNYTFISSMTNSSTTSIADNESTNTCSTTSVTTPSIRTESWIPCTVFMFGYDAIYERINSTTKRCDSAYSPTNLSSQILNDKTFISALQLIVLSRCIAYYLEIRNHCSKNPMTSGTKDNEEYSSTINGEDKGMSSSITIPTTMSKESVLDKCFGKQLDKLDSFLYYIETSQHHYLDQSSWRYRIPDGKSGLDALLDEMEDEMDHDQDSNNDNDSNENDMEIEEQQHNDHALPISTQNEECEEGVDEAMLSDNDENEQDKVILDLFEQEEFQTKTINVRNQLLKFPNNATATEVQAMSLSIQSLITACGNNEVPKLAKLLLYGGEISEQHNKEVCILSDNVLSSLYSLCVDEHSSAVKVSAFVEAFIVPKLRGAEGGSKVSRQRVSSRTMISLVSTLARDRPTECIDSLFVPLLLSCNDTNDSDTNRNSHYELISRVVKTVSLPKESVSHLLSQLLVPGNNKVDNTTTSMPWSEHSIPILTSCFQIKPHLQDNIISSITQQINECAHDKRMKSSAKFSTLFQTFVMKYGEEIRSVPACLETLLLSASQLKTFLGRNIKSKLSKL